MKSLLPATTHSLLNILCARPFTYTKEYASVKNYIDSEHIPTKYDRSLKKIAVYELGKDIKKSTTRSTYAKIPELYLHEFKDIACYRNIPFTDDGKIIFDGIRVIRANGEISANLNSPASIRPQPIGNNMYCYGARGTSKALYIDEPCIFADTMHHYGHHLLETVSQYWAFQRRPTYKIVLGYAFKEVPPYLLDTVAPLGLTKDSFVLQNEFTIFKKLCIPTRAYMHIQYVSQYAIDVWQKISRFYCKDPCADTPQHIYISRKNIKNRPLINEEQCEEAFKKHGFTVIYPEKLQVQEQIQFYAHATRIAGCSGSAMHNVVYSQRPETLKTLFLYPEEFASRRAYSILEGAYGRAFYSVVGTFVPNKNKPVNTVNGAWTIDIGNLNTAIEQWLEL